MDVLVADQPSPGAASLLQISSLDNTDDGDLFWQGDNFGQGTDGYNRPRHFYRRLLASRGSRLRYGCQPACGHEVCQCHQTGRLDDRPKPR